MKNILMLIFIIVCSVQMLHAERASTFKERKLIYAGNDLYEERKYDAALEKYQLALNENGASAEASYNIGLCYLQMAGGKNLEEEKRNELQQKGIELMEASAKYASAKPELASRANYNLGNIAFKKEDYKSALDLYKQALRLNPNDDDARRNLRITQLKLQNQDNQDQNKDDQNKENQDQNKDNQNKDKDQNKDNQDKDNQDKNQNEQQPNRQNNSNMSEEAAKQILQAMDNKENQTRNRLINGQQKNNENSERFGRRNW